MKFVRLVLCYLILSVSALAQDAGIKWDGIPANHPDKNALRQAVQHDYFKALEKLHLTQPTLLIVHCYTADMTEDSTRIVIGTVQDEVWLASTNVQELKRELSIAVFLRKQLKRRPK